MRSIINKYFVGLAFFLLVLFVATNINNISYLNISGQSASVLTSLISTTGAKPAYGYAWNDNVGWINFGVSTATDTEGQVYVSDDKLYGYAWGENIGWISMTCENDNSCGTHSYRVLKNVTSGALSGEAWGENIGWINFAPTGGGVTITTTNTNNENSFSGYAWGENIGWISFSGSSPLYSVKTSWIRAGGVSNTVTPSSLPICTFEYSTWGACINEIQTRTINPDPAGCSNSGDALSLTKTCLITATSTATTTEEEIGISISPTSSTINLGETVQFTGTVTGTTTNNLINWTIFPIDADNFYGTITNNGLYTAGTHAAEVTIIAKPRADISKEATANVSVRIRPSGPITVSVLPASTITSIGKTVQFTAIVNGTTTNTKVNWTIFPIDTDNFYGTITADGLYTASEQAVDVTIIARSDADGSVTGTADVSVRLEAYNINDNFIFNNFQKLADRSNDVANLQNRLTKEGYYSGLVGGYFGPATETALKKYQKENGLTETGELDSPTRDKLNNAKQVVIPEIDISPTSLAPGEPLTINSTNWSPNTEVAVTLHSDPVTLGTLKSDSNGSITGSFTLAEETTEGAHSIQLDGTGANGLPRTLSFSITVTKKGAATTETTDSTTPANNTGGGVSSGGSSAGGSSSSGRENIPTILNVSKAVTENIAVLGTTTQIIYMEAKKIVESPAGSAVTKTITTVGVVGGGVAATSVIAINGTVATDILLLPFRLWGLLLSALGLKKRNRPWGTVYDSVTKQPLDPAYVTLKRIGGQEENTSITDLDGRYGFLVPPGKYILTANKTNYTFPSQKMLGKTEDVLYTNLYLGEEINIDIAGAVISKNIPLDPVKFDWNEFAKGKKKLMKFYSRREKFIRIITDWIFRIGFVVSVISLFLVTAPYNLIIFGFYLILAALRKFGLRTKALGSLTEKDGTPLSYAIIRVYDSELNVEITNKVADKIGRYYCLVNKGKYYVKIEKKNDDESYSEVLTSSIFEAENGIVNKNFIV